MRIIIFSKWENFFKNSDSENEMSRYLFWHNLKYDIKIIWKDKLKKYIGKSCQWNCHIRIFEYQKSSDMKLKYSFVSLLYVLCKTKFDILLILRSSSKLANQEMKKWDICERTILWKIIHWFGKKWSLIGDTWKKLFLFLKFDFQNSNYADHQILKRNRNISNSFFVIEYRSCFTSKYFFILQMYFLESVKIIFENIFQSFASINFDIYLWWYLKEMNKNW